MSKAKCMLDCWDGTKLINVGPKITQTDLVQL